MSVRDLQAKPETVAEPEGVVIRRLARALDYAEGFWLGFAKCNSPAQRRKIVADCEALLHPLKIRPLEIELTEPITNLLPVIREHLTRAGNTRAREKGSSRPAAQTDKLAIFVYGLEHSIPSREAYPPLLSSLNLSRELFREQLPHPLVLWLPDYALTAFARKAPDFWAWRSGLYEFAPERELIDQSLAAVREQAMYVTESLPEQAKRERLTMLKGLLDDYRELGDGPREQNARAHILLELGLIHDMLGELFEARQAYEAARLIWRNLKNELDEATALHQLGRLAQAIGELDEARRLYGESMEINKRLGDQGGVAAALHQLGRLAQDEGKLDEARRLYRESLEIVKRLGDHSAVATTLHNLAILAQDEGKLDEARRLCAESMEINKKLGNQSGIAYTLHQLGRLAQAIGELDEARRLYGESMEINKRLGDQGGMALLLGQLGRLAEKEGDVKAAAKSYREALDIFERLKSPYAELVRRYLQELESRLS
ncbi:MAG TPA: tetratricopeptide repeat protein [Pyrinomonadaceae bacterium]|nr:tetratricopeptide repeat protein [Pyrinomonadaceae bacterium]